MDLVEKFSLALSDSLDYLIDKNRKKAQLNRIEAVIKNETEILNRAYIALGKHYYKMLEGKAEETDVSQICDAIKSAKLRLKKPKQDMNISSNTAFPLRVSEMTFRLHHTLMMTTTPKKKNLPKNPIPKMNRI